MIRGGSLAILTALVFALGVVSAAPRQQAMDDASLSNLELSDITFKRTFSSAHTYYTTEDVGPFNGGDVASTTVTATPTNSSATVVIRLGGVVDTDGTVTLAAGANLITVEVTAEDGVTMETYAVIVSRSLPFATRSFSSATVAPGGSLVVTMEAGRFGAFGLILETLPDGFTYVDGSSSLLPAAVNNEGGQDWSFIMVDASDKNFTYTVTVSDTAGDYTFAGVLRDFNRNDHTVGGDTAKSVVLPPGVTVSTPTLGINEGSNGTYTVVLDAAPTGAVTVTPSSDNMAVTAPGALTFTTSNWSTPQTVAVSATEDGDSTDDTATVSHAVSGYGSVATAPSVTVTVRDNEAVSPPTTGPTTGDGSSGSSSSAGDTSLVFIEGAGTTRMAPENAEAGTPVGAPISARSPVAATLTYSLTGTSTDRAPFTIDEETGQLRTGVALDYETRRLYNVDVGVTSSDGSTALIRVAIQVTDQPDPVATPTSQPTVVSTPVPTAAPALQPTATSIPQPTATPIPQPTPTPIPEPTVTPALQPTATSTTEPTATPAPEPTVTPTPTAVAATFAPVPIVEPPDEGGLPGWLWLLLLLIVAALVIGSILYVDGQRRA